METNINHNPGNVHMERSTIFGFLVSLALWAYSAMTIEANLRLATLCVSFITGILILAYWLTKHIKERKTTLKAWQDFFRGK